MTDINNRRALITGAASGELGSNTEFGEMAEWFKVLAWKASVR